MPATSFDAETLQRLSDAGLDAEHLPRHVAIIMDGNGRSARNAAFPGSRGTVGGSKACAPLSKKAVDSESGSLRFTA